MLFFMTIPLFMSCQGQGTKEPGLNAAVNQEIINSILGTWYVTKPSVEQDDSKTMIRLREETILFEQEWYDIVRTEGNVIYGKSLDKESKHIQFELIEKALIVRDGSEEKRVLKRPYINYISLRYGEEVNNNERYAKELEKMHILFEHHEPFQVSLISYTSEGAKIIETIEYDKEKIDYLKDMTADESQNKGIVTDRFDRMDYVEYVDNEGNDMEEYVLSKGDGLAHQEKVVFPLTD